MGKKGCWGSCICTISGGRRWFSRHFLVAEALQFGWRRSGKFVEFSLPSGASAGGYGADYKLFHVAGFCLRFHDLIHGDGAAVVKFGQVRSCGRVPGIVGDGVPDVGGETILSDAASVFQTFGVEILRLRQA